MTGTIALAFAGTLILFGIDKLFSLMVEQSIEGFLNAVAY
jgi:hypothetical protein